jgi:hypothetical protein
MPVIDKVNDVLHKIRIKLYPSYLPGMKGKYTARTDSEASLTVEQVCASLKNRGGFTGNYEDLTDHSFQFLDEAAYLLCDGFAINMKYFTVHPNVGGIFDSVSEACDPKKHPITFSFRTRNALRRLIEFITIDIEGLADTTGWIGEFIDFDENSVNTLCVPGDQFAIHGHKIKAAGDNPGVGVYFVPVDDPSRAVKVNRMAENTPHKITGIAPGTQSTHNRIEIRTQYNGSGSSIFKAPRVITSSFILEEA